MRINHYAVKPPYPTSNGQRNQRRPLAQAKQRLQAQPTTGIDSFYQWLISLFTKDGQ